jgi:predicted enzyme related to lactoylglutathione lyase
MMRYGEIAYEVGEVYHGRGIGTKAVRKFVDKVFAETALRRIVAYVAEDNKASRRLLEKIGFVQEGICREHYIINGIPTNEVLYGILRSDLEALNAKGESLLLEASSENPCSNAGLFSRIKAVMVHVSDPIAGLRWYEKAFPEAKKVHLPEYDFEFLILNGVQIEIVQADEKVGVGTCGLAVDWDVKSFDQALHHLINLGAVLYRGPMEIEDGNRMCKLKDPFGNLIGLRGP